MMKLQSKVGQQSCTIINNKIDSHFANMHWRHYDILGSMYTHDQNDHQESKYLYHS